MHSGGIFDYANKKDRLTEVELELGDPKVWDNPERAQELGKERSALEAVVRTLDDMASGLNDVADLLEMAASEDDTDTVTAVEQGLDALRQKLAGLELLRVSSGQTDPNERYPGMPLVG